jgi:inhibitor of KinA sporulation pathway (predicted exonuclease)
MMSLPDEDRREALLATLESSGRDFSGDIFHALESARRADELVQGVVQPISREEAFSKARRAVQSA